MNCDCIYLFKPKLLSYERKMRISITVELHLYELRLFESTFWSIKRTLEFTFLNLNSHYVNEKLLIKGRMNAPLLYELQSYTTSGDTSRKKVNLHETISRKRKE